MFVQFLKKIWLFLLPLFRDVFVTEGINDLYDLAAVYIVAFYICCSLGQFDTHIGNTFNVFQVLLYILATVVTHHTFNPESLFFVALTMLIVATTVMSAVLENEGNGKQGNKYYTRYRLPPRGSFGSATPCTVYMYASGEPFGRQKVVYCKSESRCSYYYSKEIND